MKNHQVKNGSIQIVSEKIEEVNGHTWAKKLQWNTPTAISLTESRMKKLFYHQRGDHYHQRPNPSSPSLQYRHTTSTAIRETWSLTKSDEQKIAVTEKSHPKKKKDK